MGINQVFDTPFFGGGASASSSDVPGIFQVAINGHGYIIDPKQYDRTTVPLRRESTDESVEPGEQTLNTGGAWKRSQDNWFLGAGQEYLDNRFAFVSVYVHSGEDPSVRTRFWRSKGVNPWEFGNLTLLNNYTVAEANAAGGKCIAVGDLFYFWDGTTLRSTDDPSQASITWSTIAYPPGGSWPAIESWTTDGFNLYIAVGSGGIVQVPNGSGGTVMRPAAPTISVVQNGTPGTTHYTYNLVGIDATGNKTLPGTPVTITNGNASLSPTNFIELTWPSVNGIVSWDILKADNSHSIKTAFIGNSLTDDGSLSPSSYTAPTATTDNFQADFVNYGNSFLLAGDGPQLVEVGANGSTTEVMTHYNPDFTWNAGSSSPVAIYLSGFSGNISELYGVQLSTQTFGLGAPYIAGQVTDGEIINDISYYEGLVILSTSLGVRTAQDTNTNGFLQSGPVIDDLGPSLCCTPYGAFVWAGITNFQEGDGIYSGTNSSSGTMRLSLNQFSTNLLPAYATDVMAANGDVFPTTSVAVFNGQPYFTTDGGSLYQPDPTGALVEQGYLETGWVRYGTIENKILVSLDVHHDPLQGVVNMEVVPSGGQNRLYTVSAQQGSVGPLDLVGAGYYVGEQFHVIPILQRSATDPTKGPILHRWTARAVIIANRQDQIVAPLIWADVVTSPAGNGQTIAQDLKAEWLFLQNIVTSGDLVTYQEGALSYLVMIDQIQLTQTHRWNSDRSMLEGILNVKMLTVN